MPTLLTDIRARMRIDLDDPALAVWADADLNRHIDHARRELSHHLPLQKKSTLATTAGSRDVSVATLVPRVRIAAVEYKTGQFPPAWVQFALWGDVLTIVDDPLPDGANANIFWEQHHTLDASTNTLTDELEELLILGAEGYACRQAARRKTDALNTGGPLAGHDFDALATDYLRRFQSGLRQRQGIAQRRLYPPAQPLPSQSTDPGP